MKNIVAVVLIISLNFLCSCKTEQDQAAISAASPESCKGVYYTRDNGELKKYNQYWLASQSTCMTDNLPLSQWEKSSEAWTKNKVQCTPQSQFASRTLVSANNYYNYRDGKIYLDLNSSTGVYRRIILGEDKNDSPTFTRVQGCFYQRTGLGVDVAFGKQLLLDTNSAKTATSEAFDPMEIFRYDENTTALNMTRFDDSDNGWDFKFCPYLNTPWDFCTLLRDGNIMYFPETLTNTQKDDLLAEALLIRKQFNFSVISSSAFDNLWTTVGKSRTEKSRDDWKYAVIVLPDTPWYVDAAWREYIMNVRPTMPTVSNLMPAICYQGSQNVTLSNGGTGKIYGQICYLNGIYTFTQN